jgi:hypothetical protein
VEIDDPNLTALALSFKGHLAWRLDDPHGVIALSRAARRDDRVFIAQHAYNAHQEARGWAMAGDPTQVDRILGHADKLAERAIAQQTNAPPNMYWYGSGFFALQRGLTWHTLKDARFAHRAVTELTHGLRELPEAERHSEWAAIFTIAAAEALTTAGEAERAIAYARQALAVCHATKSTRLARTLRCAHHRMCDTWPAHAEFRCVAVVGVSQHYVPAGAAVTPAADDQRSHDLDIQRERCLLFVACTRARENLLVSWHGKPSPLLPT